MKVFFLIAVILISLQPPLVAGYEDLKISKENWLNWRSVNKGSNQFNFGLFPWSDTHEGIFSDLPFLVDDIAVDESVITHSLVRINKSLSPDLSQDQKKVIEAALGKILQEYRVGRLKSGNWWHWEIGIPAQINQI